MSRISMARLILVTRDESLNPMPKTPTTYNSVEKGMMMIQNDVNNAHGFSVLVDIVRRSGQGEILDHVIPIALQILNKHAIIDSRESISTARWSASNGTATKEVQLASVTSYLIAKRKLHAVPVGSGCESYASMAFRIAVQPKFLIANPLEL